MPKLDWIGRQAVVNHDREVPYHLLQCDAELSVGDPNSGNMLVQGDNLLALKALLPYYASQVRCIYIDPPYNTGNENWVYNDNVNSPEMRAWLGSVVGGEGEDLSRHDKWLCMMYPRLRLLQRFLSRDGAIFVSIDDNEVHHLRMLMDEIFGPQNFVATIIWQKVYSPKNSARHFSEDHDYILVYANNAETWRPRLVPRTEKQDNAYRNPDGDVRGLWKPSGLDARNFYSLGTYPITCPGGRVIPGPPTGSYWRVSEEQFRKLDADNRIWWGKDKNAIPQIKRFLSEVKQGVVPQTLWTYDEVGHTQEAKQELVSTMSFENSGSVFVTPKPVRLIRRILQVATEPNSIVLDAFAGSGTTGVATLAANSADGGNRRFILVEMDETIGRTITAERLRRVINGHKGTKPGGKTEEVAGLGGGFRYCTLGPALFDGNDQINGEVSFLDLARHVYFVETGRPLPDPDGCHSPLIGVSEGVAVYLLYNGVLSDRDPSGENALTSKTLEMLPPHDGPRVVYGAACCLSQNRLRRLGITFRQIPYEVKVS